jgi:hypothetical protein
MMAFGMFSWSTAMFIAAGTAAPLVSAASPVMAGVGAGCFVVGLLPGRTARFS